MTLRNYKKAGNKTLNYKKKNSVEINARFTGIRLLEIEINIFLLINISFIKLIKQ